MDNAVKNLQLLLDSGDKTNIELAFTLMETMGDAGLVLPTRSDLATYIGMKTAELRSLSQLLIDDRPLPRDRQKTAIYTFWGILDHVMEWNSARGPELPGYLRWMKKLKKLALKNTNTKYPLGWTFSEGLEHLATSLEQLDIEGYVLTDVLWHFVRNIRQLNICYNKQLTFPNDVSVLSELKALYVRHSHFDFLRLAAFPKLSKLTINENTSEMRLDLSGTHTHLNELELKYCLQPVRFSTQPAMLQELEVIDLYRVNLVNFPFSPDQLPKLKKVSAEPTFFEMPDFLAFKAKIRGSMTFSRYSKR